MYMPHIVTVQNNIKLVIQLIVFYLFDIKIINWFKLCEIHNINIANALLLLALYIVCIIFGDINCMIYYNVIGILYVNMTDIKYFV